MVQRGSRAAKSEIPCRDFVGVTHASPLPRQRLAAINVREAKKIYRKSFSLFVIVLSLIFYFTELNGQETPRKSEREPVFSSFDPNAPPETRRKLAPYVTFGGQLELEYRQQRNLAPDGNKNGDLTTTEPGFSLAFSFDPSRYFQGYFDVKLSQILTSQDRDTENDQVSLEFEEAYLLFKNLSGDRLSFQIGRQRFDDERQWLYDSEMDAARAYLRLSRVLVELSASRENLVDRDLLNDQDEARTNDYIAYGTYAITEETNAAAYVVARDDRSAENNSPVFFGIHSDGDVTDSLDYWLELAYVLGKDRSNKIRGVGFDLGSTYIFDPLLEPSITLGYAFGTGDGDPNDGVDNGFRQTGLQGNESDFNGAADFKYYGELFDPELSNLSIITAAVGIKPTETSSIDLVYHSYHQEKASDSLSDVGIDITPDGLSRNLGNEFDLITGYEYEGIENNFELALMLGYFIPGQAFPSRSENSFLTKLVVQFEF